MPTAPEPKLELTAERLAELERLAEHFLTKCEGDISPEGLRVWWQGRIEDWHKQFDPATALALLAEIRGLRERAAVAERAVTPYRLLCHGGHPCYFAVNLPSPCGADVALNSPECNALRLDRSLVNTRKDMGIPPAAPDDSSVHNRDALVDACAEYGFGPCADLPPVAPDAGDGG